MKGIAAFLAGFAFFAVLFLILDILILNAQGLSFIFRG